MMIQVDGIEIHIERKGTGETILLVHGLGSPLVWDRLIDPLSQFFDVIAVDLPGFGSSTIPPTPFSTQQYADFLFHLIDMLQLQRTSILAVSYGGQVALTFAFDHHNRIDKLILVASSGLGPRNSFLASSPVWSVVSFLVKHLVFNSTMMIRWFSRYSFFDGANRPDDLAERFHRALKGKGRKESWLQCGRNALRTESDFSKRLTTLTVPTLIVWGKEDRIVPVWWAYEFQQGLQYSSLKILERCGHSLPLEKSVELCEEVRNFLQTERPHLSQRDPFGIILS